ncbi:hypothetical protein [Mucilaginibacter corticis]|uniref:hypothetical protein n=1 Tax=Mucilaginibacter corticis TaxID=2597670 RepID=UPI001FE77B94|nr:hypothetical protein [Mucilaginibacter corticis]
MKNLLISLTFSLLIASVANAQVVHLTGTDDRGYVVKVGDQAPADFELVLNDGTKTSLKKLQGNCHPAIYGQLVQCLPGRNAAPGKGYLESLPG